MKKSWKISESLCATDVDKNLPIQDLNAKLEKLEKKVIIQTKKLNILKSKARINAIQKHNFKKRDEFSVLKTIFKEDQILSLSRKNMKFIKWSNDTINEALELKFTCGQSGYENLLRLNLPYPSLRTLQQRLESLKFQSGILTEVFDFMKTKVDVMKINEKECVLILDEMSITESVDYDTSTSSYYGFVTLPEHYGQANHALVFMLGGISTRWKQTVAYYYTGSSVYGGVLKNIVLSIINCTEEI